MKIILIILVLAAINLTCASQKTPSPLLKESFVEMPPPLCEKDLHKRIEKVKRSISEEPDDPELHRELSVLYRIKDSPYSRMLASKEIERAIKLDPDNIDLQVEKGLILVSRRFYAEAEKTFKYILSLQPRCRKALYRLGNMEKSRYIKSMLYPDHIDKACEYFEKALRGDDDDEKFLSELIFLKIISGKSAKSEKYLDSMIRRFPHSKDSYLLKGTSELDERRFKEAEKAYLKAIELMQPEESFYYMDISLLLSPKERRSYSALDRENRREYIRRFWVDKDPTPTSSVNERLLEHYRRVFFSFRLFANVRLGHKGPDTDRGKALIRYGIPDKIARPFDKQGRAFDGPVIYWAYGYDGYGFKLYFQDEFLNGDYHIPIDPHFGLLADINRSVELSLKDAYEYPVEYDEVRLDISFLQLRGDAGKTSLRISTAIPDTLCSREKGDLSLSYSILDNGMNIIHEETVNIECDTLSAGYKGIYYYNIARHVIQTEPRVMENTLYVSCTCDRLMMRGTAMRRFEFHDFSGNALKTSGVAVSMSVGGSGCALWSDPITTYPARSFLCVGYEIYNLAIGQEGSSDYTLTYSIRPPFDEGRYSKYTDLLSRFLKGEDGPEKIYIYNTISQNSANPYVSDRLKIDTSSLKCGEYILRIEVVDLISGDSSGSETVFMLDE